MTQPNVRISMTLQGTGLSMAEALQAVQQVNIPEGWTCSYLSFDTQPDPFAPPAAPPAPTPPPPAGVTEEAKPRRPRAPKGGEAVPEPSAPASADVSAADAAAPADTAAVTVEVLRAAASVAVRAGKSPAVKQILTAAGAEGVSDVPPDRRGQVLAELNELAGV